MPSSMITTARQLLVHAQALLALAHYLEEHGVTEADIPTLRRAATEADDAARTLQRVAWGHVGPTGPADPNYPYPRHHYERAGVETSKPAPTACAVCQRGPEDFDGFAGGWEVDAEGRPLCPLCAGLEAQRKAEGRR